MAADPHTAAAAPWAPPDRILIEITPIVSGGFIGQRYNLEIRGWVVATAPVEEITLFRGETFASQMHFGPPGPTARVILPDGTAVTRHVFTMSLPMPRSEAGGPCGVTIIARTVNNQSHRETYSLMVDPLLPTQVRVESGPTRPAADYAGELAPVILFVERAALDSSGYLQLVGWVVSLSTLVAIQVFADEERTNAPKLGVRRDDVASVFPSYPNALSAGFTLATALGETAREATTLRVQAICADGFAHQVVVPLERVARLAPPSPPQEPPRRAEPPSVSTLSLLRQDPVYHLVTGFNLLPDVLAATGGYIAPAPVATPTPPRPTPPRPAARQSNDPRRVINFFCDVATLSVDGQAMVEGWAVCAIGIATVEVWVGNQRLGEAEVGLPRDDVGEEYRSIPMARYAGFRFAGEVASLADGEHQLRVILRNGLDDLVEHVSVHVITRPKPVLSVGTAQEFRFEIDTPALVDGAVVAPVTGRLTIEGWILSRSGVTEMQVWLDEQRVGDAYYGLARQDVANAFPDWPNALRSGYAFHCPPRSLRNGGHVVKITARSQSGAEMERSFHIDVRKPEGSDDSSTIRRRMPLVEIDMLTETLAALDQHPAFRLVLRQNGPIDPTLLGRTFAALHGQVYRDWRLTVLAEDSDSADVARASLAEHGVAMAGRVTVVDASATGLELDTPFGAGEAVTGPLLYGLLCPGDELGCDALLEIALANGQASGTDFLYADEVRISPTSHEREPFCKPDFSPDLLLSTNYIGRPWFATSELLARAEVTPRALLRDAEYDIVLRCTEEAAAVHHLPKLLCRRGGETLDSPSAARAALRRAAVRRGVRAEVQETPIPNTFRFRRLRRATGKVSIIIPTCAAHDHIETCVRTLRERTGYANFEIVCIDNIPAHQVGWKRWVAEHADKVVDIPEAFNWSRFNNRGVEAADGEYLLFLNDDIEVIDAGWLEAMLEHVQRPEVGIVGAQLSYPGGKVQHAGMFLATMGIARHAFRFSAADEPGYFGLALTQRNVIAVTGACMLVRREVFDAIGGFDEAHEIINNDLDFCLRAHQAGLLTVYTPYARLLHHELASRDQLGEVFDSSHFERQWKTQFAAGDPYFSPLLSRHADDYRPDDEPVEGVFAGHPMYRRDDIKRILAVKLDHIGDFITALPAMRRLKAHFPTATLHVLAARGARAFAEIESCIDGFIEFEFFHARSGLGQRDLTADDYTALHDRLVPYGFDLAIDLRKHDDTREALRHVPARFLAGYDRMGQFGFLDIALEWEGDQNLHRKRSHVTDDLVNLVEAVATAATEARTSLTTPTWPAAALPGFLDDAARALFVKPVVAVHPGVGTVMRQWPAVHFAALTDLLVETHDVNVLLIGGPDEVDLAQEVLDKVVRREAVVSVTGKTSLAELTQLLACCALYVGNNSGPKHIAAAIGAPTIGVHSGVIDSVEWAPIGKRALALRRNMTCSPCYLARPVDCPRNLDCLRQLEPVSVWQACRALLAASRMPVYDTAPVAQPIEVAVEVVAERASPPSGRKPRAGRPLAGGKSAAQSPASTVAVDAASSTVPPTERPAEVAAETASPSGGRKARARRKHAAGKAATEAAAPAVASDAPAQAEPASERTAEDPAAVPVTDLPMDVAPYAEREGESDQAVQPDLEPAAPVEAAAPVATPIADDAVAPPASIDALDRMPEPTGEGPDGGGEAEEAATAADEADATQALEPMTESQPDD
jgi:ADP-heptose:LPS heptosyltransferase/GT2 family glycosyltransferase